MIVNLPSDRTIVVDAKTPLDAFLEATEADDEQRGPLLERHANHILTQVHNLSKKEYIKQLPRTPDFVVLFIPGESFLQAAVQVRPDLLEEAMELNVVIATPTTLISLLKAVAVGWREQQLAENAQRISQTGEELYRRLTTMFGHLASLRKALMSTNDHFNKLIGSLESNVLPQARRFEQLGAATDKTIEATPQIEVIPRQINAALPSGKPDEQPEDRSA
jgi:DNA recombination protein RmuC